ncbi:Kynurenine--oxoglutarate transaminase 3-like protein [Leptotrombidium deliense]|uniref:kynurenine--oxoglutarate transaminase n=1 Tax=Leptotrombidium deliense TaxID=299467 RepID=A0A443RV09_9ACAR|nr:Kynurenine--oxoglutarate transaminase 3-like protein [Leptotrombidium deliense]
MVRGQDWILDQKELRSKFSYRTKMFILNTPNNPTGKERKFLFSYVFTLQELEMIAALCIKFDTLLLMDEVYEWMIFENNKHIRMSIINQYIRRNAKNNFSLDTLPGMWNRTITIGSTGKAFSLTGWKIGYAYGPEHLIKPLKIVHQYAISICSTPLQEALAIGYETEFERLNQPSSFFIQFANSLQEKRDLLSNMLSEVYINAVIPEGGMFIVADIRHLANRVNFTSEEGETKDWKFVNWLSKNRVNIFCSIFR